MKTHASGWWDSTWFLFLYVINIIAPTTAKMLLLSVCRRRGSKFEFVRSSHVARFLCYLGKVNCLGCMTPCSIFWCVFNSDAEATEICQPTKSMLVFQAQSRAELVCNAGGLMYERFFFFCGVLSVFVLCWCCCVCLCVDRALLFQKEPQTNPHPSQAPKSRCYHPPWAKSLRGCLLKAGSPQAKRSPLKQPLRLLEWRWGTRKLTATIILPLPLTQWKGRVSIFFFFFSCLWGLTYNYGILLL